MERETAITRTIVLLSAVVIGASTAPQCEREPSLIYTNGGVTSSMRPNTSSEFKRYPPQEFLDGINRSDNGSKSLNSMPTPTTTPIIY